MANGGRLEEGDFCQTQALCQEKDYGIGCSVRHVFFHLFNCLFRKHVLMISYKEHKA